MLLRDIGVVVLAYLIGSLPFAHVLTRWRTGLAIHEVGEGNVGARNVWHVVGPGWGLLAGLLDISKGMIAVLLAAALEASPGAVLLAGPGAIVGHAFPLFLRFRGGKGVATTAGVIMAWAPAPALAALALFGLAQALLRDFNRSIVVGVLAGILLPLPFGYLLPPPLGYLLPPPLGYPWTLSVYATVLFCSLALKKRLDLEHERRVWQSAGWQDNARPGFYRDSQEDPQHSAEAPEQR